MGTNHGYLALELCESWGRDCNLVHVVKYLVAVEAGGSSLSLLPRSSGGTILGLI